MPHALRYGRAMTWSSEQKTRFLDRLAEVLERTCAHAIPGADQNAEIRGARLSQCRAAIVSLRRGQMPDTGAMQDLLTTAGSLTTRSSFSTAYALGAASSDALVRLYVKGHGRPLELAAPRDLLRRHGLAPERALLVHLRHATGEIPKGDIILVEKTPVSLDRKPFVVLRGSHAFVEEVAAIAPYILWSHEYGIFTSSRVHRLAEEDGITPLGRAVATFSGAPLPELDEAQSTEFDIIRDVWQRHRG